VKKDIKGEPPHRRQHLVIKGGDSMGEEGVNYSKKNSFFS
jgi:hypothetical protein